MLFSVVRKLRERERERERESRGKAVPCFEPSVAAAPSFQSDHKERDVVLVCAHVSASALFVWCKYCQTETQPHLMALKQGSDAL